MAYLRLKSLLKKAKNRLLTRAAPNRRAKNRLLTRAAPKLVALLACGAALQAAGVTYQGAAGPGRGKHIVLVAGDDAEYHSEEALPALGKILAVRHGFTCTVLFSMNAEDGTIDPRSKRNIPGLEALKTADLLILFIRWRDLPDAQMKEFVDYFESGRPILALRTGTHPFELHSSRTYEKWSWDSKVPGWEGGFGRRILGETWVTHHGDHGHQSTRGWFAAEAAKSPIMRGIKDGEIWGPTDTYEVRLPMQPTCRPLLLGQVLSWLSPEGSPVAGKNDPMMPIAWTNTFTTEGGRKARAFTSTIGAADDIENEGLRRMIVNATYWALSMESAIPAKANVAFVGKYDPHSFLNEIYAGGVKPSDLALTAAP